MKRIFWVLSFCGFVLQAQAAEETANSQVIKDLATSLREGMSLLRELYKIAGQELGGLAKEAGDVAFEEVIKYNQDAWGKEILACYHPLSSYDGLEVLNSFRQDKELGADTSRVLEIKYSGGSTMWTALMARSKQGEFQVRLKLVEDDSFFRSFGCYLEEWTNMDKFSEEAAKR